MKKHLVSIICSNSKTLINLPFLQDISKNGFQNEECLHSFLKQKYGSVVSYFMEFLLNGHDLAKKNGYSEISESFLSNWYEESGIDILTGEQLKGGSHEEWRIRSLLALAITNDELVKNVLTKGTREHNHILLSELVPCQDIHILIGALLQVEHFVGFEMRSLIKGFENPASVTYGEFTKVNPNTNNATHQYWYDHAIHDPRHFNEIFQATLNTKGLNIERVKQGIDIMYRAKYQFYSQRLGGYTK